MTIEGLLLRIIRRSGFLTRRSMEKVLGRIRTSESRKKLNDWYLRRNYDELATIQNIYSKLFRDHNITIEEGDWKVMYRGKMIRMPLRNDSLWLDWDNALSIKGHDPDVKQTYEYLLDTGEIDTVLDVGGNYGTHSLLFLSQAVRCITFEPNEALRKEFNGLCDLNGLKGEFENCAVGDHSGPIDFYFPEKETWLGTVVSERMDDLKRTHEFKKITVPCITLDAYYVSSGLRPQLIKIDTEGSELQVLKGAVKLISEVKPLIIFETFDQQQRRQIWQFFHEVGYQVQPLPFSGKRQGLDEQTFLTAAGFNFIGLPAGN